MANDLTKDRLLRREDLRLILNCSGRSVERYCSSGRIPTPVRISGGARRWKLSDIDLFLECDCNMGEFQARKEAQS
jgi:predicted DNA-binding transcriptional regulator AlpA